MHQCAPLAMAACLYISIDRIVFLWELRYARITRRHGRLVTFKEEAAMKK